MTQELYKTILKKFKAYGRILFSNKIFYFNGIDNYDDILIKGNLKKKSKTVLISYKDKQKEEINKNIKEITNLIHRFISFRINFIMKKIKTSNLFKDRVKLEAI